MKKDLLFLLFVISVYSGSGQDTLSLKLQDAQEAAVRNNKEIIVATLEQESAQAKFNQTNAVFLPQINISYTAMTTNNPLNAFGFKLQQRSIAQTDFNPSLLNNPAATQNFMTKAEWNQPIINMDILYARKAANQQVDMYAFKTRRTKEYLTYEVQKAYAQLQLSHQSVGVLDETLETMKATYKATNDRFEKGFLQKSDVLQVQVQVATTETKLAEAKSNVRNVSDYLSLLMGAKSGPIYKVESMEKNQVQDIKSEVSEERADFKAMKSALSAQESMIHSNKLSYLPKLNAFANYMFNDKSAFGFGANAYLVGAQFSWNIFSGTSGHYKTVEQRLEHAKTEQQLDYKKAQSQLELNKTIRQLDDTNIALQQQELSINQATEALRILQNRFDQGLVTTMDLLHSQTLVAQQKLNQAQALFQFNTTLAYLEFLTTTSEK